MKDFKTYSSGHNRTGRKLLKIILLVVLLSAAAGLFLLYREQPTDSESVQPADAEPTPGQQGTDRITVPLLLPGQDPQEGRAAPLPKYIQVSAETFEHQQAPAPKPVISSKLDSADRAKDQTNRLSHKITRGDTLSSIFKEFGLSTSLLYKIINSSKAAKKLTDIKPGEILHVELDQEQNLKRLTLEYDKVNSFSINADDSGFTSSEQSKEVEQRTAHIHGVIENSLYVSAKETGLPEVTIMELAEIFGWDIDFALEIRSGDSFTVIFEEDFLNGEKLRTGPILAAEFVNQGRSYRAVRYEDASGKADYYTPDGRSMRKAFLRAPVDFRRISSHFAKQRWHPVLGKKRPHRGVDYAASTGTPIKAAGDGKVIHRAKKGGYGNTIIIQHAQGYTTLYGHMSRYEKSVRQGSGVKQGQIIGYVGQSGLATGPHLHYEFRVNGVHRNPLTVKLPDAEPIAQKYRADFLLKTQPLIAQLDTLHRILVADAR